MYVFQLANKKRDRKKLYPKKFRRNQSFFILNLSAMIHPKMPKTQNLIWIFLFISWPLDFIHQSPLGEEV